MKIFSRLKYKCKFYWQLHCFLCFVAAGDWRFGFPYHIYRCKKTQELFFSAKFIIYKLRVIESTSVSVFIIDTFDYYTKIANE